MDDEDAEDIALMEQIARNLNGVEAPVEQVAVEIQADEINYIQEMASDLCIELSFPTN